MNRDGRENINSMKTNTEGNILSTEKKVETASFYPQIWRCHITMMLIRGDQIFKKSGIHQKVLGTRRVIQSKFHNVGPQILSATTRHLVTTATWGLGVVHPLWWYNSDITYSFAYIFFWFSIMWARNDRLYLRTYDISHVQEKSMLYSREIHAWKHANSDCVFGDGFCMLEKLVWKVCVSVATGLEILKFSIPISGTVAFTIWTVPVSSPVLFACGWWTTMLDWSNNLLPYQINVVVLLLWLRTELCWYNNIISVISVMFLQWILWYWLIACSVVIQLFIL